MARGITETDVHAAADAVLASGERPTVERIRAHLGTGSPNTVVRWLETWWGTVGQRLVAQRAKLALPDVPDEVAALAMKWWEQALGAARADAERALVEERTGLETLRRDLAEREGAWQTQIHQHAAVVAQTQQLLAAAEQRLADLQRTCDLLEGSLTDVSLQREQLQARHERIEGELAVQQRRAADRETALAVEREAQAQHMRALEERMHTEVDRARQETKFVRAELAARTRQLEAELQTARERESGAQRLLTQAQKDLAAQHARADTLERQLERVNASRKAAVHLGARGPSATRHLSRKRRPDQPE